MSIRPQRISIGHLLFALAGIGAEFLVLVAAVLLHHLNLWPRGSLFLGLYKGFTIFNLLLIFLNLYPHDGSDGEAALAIISELRGRVDDDDEDPKGE